MQPSAPACGEGKPPHPHQADLCHERPSALDSAAHAIGVELLHVNEDDRDGNGNQDRCGQEPHVPVVDVRLVEHLPHTDRHGVFAGIRPTDDLRKNEVDPRCHEGLQCGGYDDRLRQRHGDLRENLPLRAAVYLRRFVQCLGHGVKEALGDVELYSGSLLGIQYNSVKSLPVGFEERINMYPLDFEEFLWALNYPAESIRYIKECFEKQESVGSAAHERMLRLFDTYMVVGGMPEAVQTYVSTKDITETVRIQKQILDLYRQDISKYAQGLMSLKIRQIFDSIPSQLDDKNRRFMLSRLGKGQQMRGLESSFLWLEEAGVALPCYNTSAPVSPLRLNEKLDRLQSSVSH